MSKYLAVILTALQAGLMVKSYKIMETISVISKREGIMCDRQNVEQDSKDLPDSRSKYIRSSSR